MLIQFNRNGNPEFVINPDSIGKITYIKESRGTGYCVVIEYSNSSSTEISVTSEINAMSLMDNIVESSNNLAHYIINLEVYCYDL